MARIHARKIARFTRVGGVWCASVFARVVGLRTALQEPPRVNSGRTAEGVRPVTATGSLGNAARATKILMGSSTYSITHDSVVSVGIYSFGFSGFIRYFLIVALWGDLADNIVRDIRSVYNDIHIRVEYNPNLEKDIIAFTTSKAGAGKVSNADIARDERQNFYFKKIEILPSNIGYIEFTNFASPNPSARKAVHAAMQFVSHADALILDMRNNYGGNGAMANEILSYFFAAKTYTGKSFNRMTNTWSDNYIENKKAITGGVVLTMPVYILTSNRTFSAAEGVAYTLRHIKQDVVVIGDTTRGGAHLTRSFSLGHGFVGFIPYMRGENVTTKTDWEGTGVIPDTTVDEKNCLQAAQNVILHKKLSATTDETAKRKLNWLLNYYKSKNSSLGVNSSDAIKFTGNFAEFEITCKDNQLMCRDTNQPHSTPEQLIPITSTLFQVGATYQIECVIDESGSCDTIKMYWDDGWVESIPRTK